MKHVLILRFAPLREWNPFCADFLMRIECVAQLPWSWDLAPFFSAVCRLTNNFLDSKSMWHMLPRCLVFYDLVMTSSLEFGSHQNNSYRRMLCVTQTNSPRIELDSSTMPTQQINSHQNSRVVLLFTIFLIEIKRAESLWEYYFFNWKEEKTEASSALTLVSSSNRVSSSAKHRITQTVAASQSELMRDDQITRNSLMKFTLENTYIFLKNMRERRAPMTFQPEPDW